MNFGTIKTSELDNFVVEIDKYRGIEAPVLKKTLRNFKISLNTKVDQTLDLYSDIYFTSQLNVYREISSRELNQNIGEQFEFDPSKIVDSPNP